jgi:hypothetical protein
MIFTPKHYLDTSTFLSFLDILVGGILSDMHIMFAQGGSLWTIVYFPPICDTKIWMDARRTK